MKVLTTILVACASTLLCNSGYAQTCGPVPFTAVSATATKAKCGISNYVAFDAPRAHIYLVEIDSTVITSNTNSVTSYEAGENKMYGEGGNDFESWSAGTVTSMAQTYCFATNVTTYLEDSCLFTTEKSGSYSNYYGLFDTRSHTNEEVYFNPYSALYEESEDHQTICTEAGTYNSTGWSGEMSCEVSWFRIFYWSPSFTTNNESIIQSSTAEDPDAPGVEFPDILVTCTPTYKFYEQSPPPEGGTASRSYTLDDEYTTAKLKANTQAKLAEIDLGDTNLVWSTSGSASLNISEDELDCQLGKCRYAFEYETETNTIYEVKHHYTVWTNGTVSPANLVLSRLVEGDGKTRRDVHEIVPLVEEGSIMFADTSGEEEQNEGGRTISLKGKQRPLIGEIASSMAIAVKQITVTPFGGTSCSGGGCSETEASPGSGHLSLETGARFYLSLGHTATGLPSGQVRMEQDQLNPSAYTPNSLSLLTIPSFVTTITNIDGSLRQIGSSQCLGDIQVLNPGRSYSITFYPVNALIPNNGNNLIPTNGLTQEVAWIVDNPDTISSNRLRIVEVRGSLRITNIFTWIAGSERWELLAGNGLRKEVVSNTWDMGHTVRSELRQVVTPATGQVVAQTTRTYQIFDWGEGLVQEVEGSGSGSRTNSYSYHSDGRLNVVTNPTGGIRTYTYDERGRVSTDLSNLGDSEYSEQVTYTYADIAGFEAYGDNPELWPTRPRKVATLHSQNCFLAISAEQNVEVAGSGEPFAPGSLCTTNWFYPDGHPHATRLKRVGHPDGTMTFYTYGLDASSVTNVVATGSPNAGRTDISSGTKTVTVQGPLGEVLRREVYDVSNNGATVSLTGRETYNYTDAFNRSHWVTHLDGTSNMVQYACCGLELTQDRDGTLTQYYYDDLKRRVAVKNVSLNVTSSDILDAAGRVLVSFRTGSDGTRITNSMSAYDLAGQVASKTNALGGVTTFVSNFDVDGHLVRTTTYPDGGQHIETFYKDGQLYQITGSATHPVRYTDGGNYRDEVKLDENGNQTSEVTTTYTDAIGRTSRIYQNGGWSYFDYNSRGQLHKQTDPDSVITLFQYNEQGEREYTVIDMDQDGEIDFNGTDRITRTVRDVISNYGTVVHRVRVYVWATNNIDAPLLISTTERSVDGLRSWRTVWNNGVGGTTRAQKAFSSNGYSYTTNTAPDGSYTVGQARYGRALMTTSYNPSGVQLSRVTYAYDSHGRQRTATDARNGTTTYAYNAADLVTSVTTPPPADGIPAQVTTTYYNKMLQATNVVHPDGASVYTSYHPTGLRKMTWGGRTYPVDYDYDAQGRLKMMKTWQDASNPNTIATTTWVYNGYGQLAMKSYQDDTGPGYSYTSAGRLNYRSWGRGSSASYYYNNAGDLSEIYYYSGGLSPVYLEYNRLGRAETVTQGQMSTFSLYSPTGQLLSETYSGGPLDGVTVTNSYDSLLRRTNVQAFSAGGQIAAAAYAFDSSSRLQSVGGGAHSVGYTYLPNSALAESLVFKQGTNVRMTTTKSYDLLNRLIQISSTPSGASPVSSTYQNNRANQRTRNTLADGSYWVYQYDDLGQVISGKKYWSDGTPVAGQQFEYAFDDIGNRIATGAGGDESGSNLREAGYQANLLNQYDWRTVPGAADIMGIAIATNAVTVNGQAAYRKGEYFRKEVPVDNSAGPVWTNISVVGGQASVSGHTLVAPDTESFTYDQDGNLTGDGLWTYGWDGENRLSSMESVWNLPDEAKKRMEFAYDWKGRRIEKVVYAWDPDWYWYMPQYTNRFVYDEWNLIAVLDCNNDPLLSFTWGTDLSGSMQGAGGVGGLLSVTVHSGPITGTYFYCYDGNGNVVALVNAADGTVAARYEYGPFGELIRATGPMAMVNPFRFSSKYQDDETRLLYYGYRYYDSNTGRWLGRDPVEEHGGANLYNAAQNDLVGKWDLLGNISSDTIQDIFDLALSALDPLYSKCQACTGNIGVQSKCFTCCGVTSILASGIATATFVYAQTQCPKRIKPWEVVTCMVTVRVLFAEALKGIRDRDATCKAGCKD